MRLLNVTMCGFRYQRFEVLSVFSSTILAQLGSLFILKERYRLFSLVRHSIFGRIARRAAHLSYAHRGLSMFL